ncbi:hypothetical protein [Leifsonia xyli]|uniref:hypothetical protein n=1 Tax=Leifsonia xyli TaxID=1575 RepID=UPI003D671225
MDLRDVAGELYAAEPGDFIARRNAAAAQADKPTAKEIKALRKPSASAAAINALVREHPDLIGDVLQIGSRMRDAFASRDRSEIRSLTQERQRLLQRATEGLDLSPAVQREVEETLQAAVIDPAAAAAVRSGMLLRALESTGLEQVDVSEAVALPVEIEDFPAPTRSRRKTAEAPSGAPARKDGGTADEEAAESAEGLEPPAEPVESASERRERERRIRAAEKAVERARADADALDDELDETVDRRGDLEAERDRLQRKLQRVADDLTETRASERELRGRLNEAQHALRDAERTLRDARDD